MLSIIIPLLLFMFLSIDAHAYQRNIKYELYYIKGQKLSREESTAYGALFAGIVCGFTLPYITFLTTELAYKNSNKSDLAGAAGAAAGLSFWIWSGNAIIKSRKIDIPEPRYKYMKEVDKEAFRTGYKDGVNKMRTDKYAKGIYIGTGLSVLAAFITLGYIVSTMSFEWYGDV